MFAACDRIAAMTRWVGFSPPEFAHEDFRPHL